MQKIGRFIIMILFFSTSFLAAGCNTVHGFGQDVQSGGQAIEKAAKSN